ncbi:hypothetical protein rtp26 [Escherichia phage Rtp]|uniref:Uncharacterized protein n=1 Tax=Escherichia phage Rtp TaxID=2994041 RepID=Q333F8_9CAUD|nr:hypothetical protein rtp26 [Escherichia phage Rtp]CAJ42230.1 hypothetical protein [Escherichia phage Rtp]
MAIRSVALAGMVSDTSLYNIDGACVVGGANAIPVGTVVGASVPADERLAGHKVITATGITADNVYGVVVRSHYETPDGTARVNEAVNVMTHGRIWVRTSLTAAPTFGAPVLVSATGLVESAGAVETGWTFAGGYIANTGTDPQNLSVDGALVEVQVKQK